MEKEVKLTLNERIKMARKYKGISQKELANAIGVSQARISEYEKGTRTPKTLRLKIIAKALKLELLYEQGQPYFYDAIITDDPEDYPERDLFNQEQEYSVTEDVKTIACYDPWIVKIPPVEESDVNYETRLLNTFNDLNERGQRKVVAYTEDLARIDEYIK